MCSARVRRKPQDPDVIPEVAPPTAHGQQVSTDTVMIARSPYDKKTAAGGEYCCQTNRDSYSGIMLAYPLKQRIKEKHAGVEVMGRGR